MKKISFIIALFIAVFAQNSLGQDTTKQTQVPQLLSLYYGIKDALVAGDATNASSKAGAFIKSLNGIDYKTISEGNINALLKDAGKISENLDLKKQREYFASFSSNMIAVARAIKLSDQPIYEAYCPMKKSYWLSSEKAIKNPYFGSSMLTCGEVTHTFP